MAIEIVDFPIKKVIFHSYVKLPEGKGKFTEKPTFTAKITLVSGVPIFQPIH